MNMNDGDAHGGASSDDSRGKMTDAEKKVLMVRQPLQSLLILESCAVNHG